MLSVGKLHATFGDLLLLESAPQGICEGLERDFRGEEWLANKITPAASSCVCA